MTLTCSVATEEELGKVILWNQKDSEGKEYKAPLHRTSPDFLLVSTNLERIVSSCEFMC